MQQPFRPDDGALSGPQHIWRAACVTFAGRDFTIRELHGYTNGVARSTVKDLIQTWVRFGVAEVTAPARWEQKRPARYRITQPGAYPPVRRRPSFADDRGRRQKQLWNAMRTLAHWSIRELAMAASTDDTPVSVDIARSSVGRLHKAGAVIALRPYSKGTPGVKGGGATAGVYRLKPSANTGPLAPRFVAGALFDPNRERGAA